MDAPVPVDGDGRVLFEAFEPAAAAARPLREAGPWDVERMDAGGGEDEAVSDRLRSLGYL
jgi:hypothetical protein